MSPRGSRMPPLGACFNKEQTKGLLVHSKCTVSVVSRTLDLSLVMQGVSLHRLCGFNRSASTPGYPGFADH